MYICIILVLITCAEGVILPPKNQMQRQKAEEARKLLRRQKG